MLVQQVNVVGSSRSRATRRESIDLEPTQPLERGNIRRGEVFVDSSSPPWLVEPPVQCPFFVGHAFHANTKTSLPSQKSPEYHNQRPKCYYGYGLVSSLPALNTDFKEGAGVKKQPFGEQ